MTAQFARAPYTSGARPTAPVYNAPHAALLIDFDNVTMGIRSDLTKELRNLLNSDIIKGKVAVQRAYADWRRYPQYIVPLAENSVDLIFAPAYGSSKKNATDIRLSIDALELVFTRPEIGTFILLSGDSDFSSLVLKLKEYGKYVIGVGIRESASDLLVQNCDEYYSYSALTGLTRAGDEETKAWDPWECVETAVQRMTDHNDVMRSDRLKQVMIELDPNFDEKSLGFTKFNRFIQEAANRGLIALNKLENGQFEVGVIDPMNVSPVVTTSLPAGQADEQRPRRSRRGGRDRHRGNGDRETGSLGASAPEVAAPAAAPEAAAPAAAPEAAAPEAAAVVAPELVGVTTQITEPPRQTQPEAVPAVAQAVQTERPPRRERSERPERPERPERLERPERPQSPSRPATEAPAASGPLTLTAAYDLLKRATRDVSGGKTAARDSDIKRRILEMHPDWNEPALGFSKFSRFLRQAHDAEVINLHKLENGNYEVTLPGTQSALQHESSDVRGGKDRSRRGSRGRSERPERSEPPREARSQPQPPPQQQLELKSDATTATEPASREPSKRPAPAVASAAPQTQQAQSLMFRGGSRKRTVASGPPPMLPGQGVGPKPSPAAEAPKAEAPKAEAPKAEAAKAEAPKADTPKADSPKALANKAARGKTATAAPAKAPAKAEKPKPAEKLEKVDAITAVERLVAYKGVGQKTAEAAIEAFGASKLFDVLRTSPDKIVEKLGARRAQPIIDGFAGDAPKPATKTGAAKKATRGSRGGKSRRKKSGAPRA